MPQESKFRPGDKVFARDRHTNRFELGPYIVAFVPRAKKYLLNHLGGHAVEGGREFEEHDLQRAWRCSDAA